jgi:hypothetical protein
MPDDTEETISFAAARPASSPGVAPAASNPLARSTVFGNLPVPPTLSAHRLTPLEEAMFEKLGHPKGEPVPNIQDFIAAVRQREAEAAGKRLEDLPPLDYTSKTVDMINLTAADQAKYQQILADAQRAEAGRQERRSMEPSIAGALREVEAIESTGEIGGWEITGSTGVVNKIRAAAKPQTAAAPESPPLRPAIRPARPQQPEPPELDNQLSSAPADQLTPTGAGAPATRCPRCQFDLNETDLVEPTYDDKIAYLEAIHGGRFRKEYTLFGGALSITFRSLTTEELTLCDRQLYQDVVLTRRVQAPREQARRSFGYEISCAIERIAGTGRKTQNIPPVLEMGIEPKAGETVIADAYDYVTTRLFTNHSVLTAVAGAYGQFQAVCRKLEDVASNPDFWQGIL